MWVGREGGRYNEGPYIFPTYFWGLDENIVKKALQTVSPYTDTTYKTEICNLATVYSGKNSLIGEIVTHVYSINDVYSMYSI